MRVAVLISVTLYGLLAPAAMACPPRDACLVELRSTVRDREPPPPAKRIALQLDIPGTRRSRVRPLPTEEIEMPWIWRVLREQVYSRMPTVKEDESFKIVLAPVVVTSPSDTVPGVGLAGDF